jgi:hypothetical protein
MSGLPAASDLGDIDAITARTSRSYDLLPYVSNPFPRAQPSPLAAVANNVGALFAAFTRAALLWNP